MSEKENLQGGSMERGDEFKKPDDRPSAESVESPKGHEFKEGDSVIIPRKEGGTRNAVLGVPKQIRDADGKYVPGFKAHFTEEGERKTKGVTLAELKSLNP